MEWISVHDRLPEPGLCLAFVKEHDPQVYIDGFGGVSEDYYGFAHELLFSTKVTHWMPLPEPPKDKDGS